MICKHGLDAVLDCLICAAENRAKALVRNAGAKAFAFTGHPDDDSLTKREYFAGLAMQGLLAAGEQGTFAGTAKLAIEQADALLAELAK